MGSQPVLFPSGTITCEGVLVRSEEGTSTPGLVICHPYPLHGGDMENNIVRALAEAFAAAGFAVLRFNFRGVGKSEGRYAEGIGEQEDARAALTWLSAQTGIDADQLFLAGYSFGARVTLAVAATDPRVCGFIVVAPPVLGGQWPSLESSRGPKVFLSGARDPYAPSEVLIGLVKSLAEPKRLVVFPDTDHFFVGQERRLAQHAVTQFQALS
jgi:uncharacterized protein